MPLFFPFGKRKNHEFRGKFQEDAAAASSAAPERERPRSRPRREMPAASFFPPAREHDEKRRALPASGAFPAAAPFPVQAGPPKSTPSVPVPVSEASVPISAPLPRRSPPGEPSPPCQKALPTVSGRILSSAALSPLSPSPSRAKKIPPLPKRQGDGLPRRAFQTTFRFRPKDRGGRRPRKYGPRGASSSTREHAPEDGRTSS